MNKRDLNKVIFSVIVPSYREEKIIENTLGLFTPEIKKKYGIELILSDGGSNDKTVEIAKKYADKIICHTEERRQTIAEGRNKGAERALGDNLIFLNADSVPADINSFFEILSEWTQGKGKYAASEVLACIVSIDPTEILLKDKIFYAFHNNYVRFLNFIGMGMGRGECQILTRNAFEKAGRYNPALTAGEDFDLYKRAGKIAKISFAEDLLIYESPRRFRKYGYLKVLWIWTKNALAVMFSGRSASEDWEPVR